MTGNILRTTTSSLFCSNHYSGLLIQALIPVIAVGSCPNYKVRINASLALSKLYLLIFFGLIHSLCKNNINKWCGYVILKIRLTTSKQKYIILSGCVPSREAFGDQFLNAAFTIVKAIESAVTEVTEITEVEHRYDLINQ